jgi:hypothetical protein
MPAPYPTLFRRASNNYFYEHQVKQHFTPHRFKHNRRISARPSKFNWENRRAGLQTFVHTDISQGTADRPHCSWAFSGHQRAVVPFCELQKSHILVRAIAGHQHFLVRLCVHNVLVLCLPDHWKSIYLRCSSAANHFDRPFWKVFSKSTIISS